jgi:cellular nucleic acid-binding protein
MVFIYILELENKKYYIGKTINPGFRLEQHFNSCGSQWTKKYKPKKVLEIIPNCDNFDEDKYTLKYMEQYGINNVRGGSFCEIKLSDNNITTLNQMINSVTDKCYICGKNDHYANDCKKEKISTIDENCDCMTSYFSPHRRSKCLLNSIISYFYNEDDDIDKLLAQQKNNNNTKQEENKENSCFRCGREGHYASDCYAKKTIKGNEIEDSSNEVFNCSYCNKEFDTLKSVICHQNLYCKNKKVKQTKTNACYKCGREGHYASSCYASKHINGRTLS